MTIAVGILASDGVVLAADSEVTHGAIAKTAGRKIEINFHWGKQGPMFNLVAGAGTAHYIDAFAQQLRRDVAAHRESAAVDIQQVIEATVEDFHGRHVIPFGLRLAGSGPSNLRGIPRIQKSVLVHFS